MSRAEAAASPPVIADATAGAPGVPNAAAAWEERAEAAAPPRARASATSPALIIAMMLLIAMVLPWITSFAEWTDYRRSDFVLGRREWSWGELPLVWVFYGKTQLVVLPGVLVAVALAARRWVNVAQVVLLAWLALVMTWVVVEKQTYLRTTVHALDYLRFLGDEYAAQWAGNLRAMTYTIGSSLLELTRWLVAAMAIILLIVRLAGWATRRFGVDEDVELRGARGRRIFAAGCAALYAAMIVAVVPAQHLYRDRVSLLRTHALLPYNFTWSAVGLELVDTGKFAKPLNRLLEPKLRQAMPVLNAGAPPDPHAVITTGGRPNVVIIAIESLRADALTSAIMPRLHALTPRAMELRQHRSGARMTHLGLYSLLTARSPTFYWPTTEAWVPPQAAVTFRKSGYRISYVGSAHHAHWLNMGNYISDKFFDEVRVHGDKDWPAMDVQTLARTTELLRNAPDGKPQFVMTFLTSTHYPYVYPPEFETRRPVLAADWSLLPFDAQRDLEGVVNRYRNSCGHMDRLITDFLAGIDLSKTIVVITGDHGESFWDDGSMTHGGRWSDPQMRVPCLIIGANVKPQVVEVPTNHMDVLPTVLHLAAEQAVPLRNVTGNDLIADQSRPACEALSAESHDGYYEMLLMMGGRRLLVEFPSDRYEVLVRGTVDANGIADAFNLPPPAEAQMWADGISYHLDRLTQLRVPAAK